ncbi:MAG TPA: DUF3576 domain-containing protein [Caulobacteraceae bacterium]|jgi:hypothetical protein
MTSKRVITLAAAAILAAGLAGCGTVRRVLPGGGEREAAAPAGPTPTIGVNGYLWRATLDTLAFMPMASADPWGGTVITDWYSSPEKPDERFKATVYILDTRLRADGLKVAISKQLRAPDGSWQPAAASPQTEQDIQNAILTRARQLRLSNVNG